MLLPISTMLGLTGPDRGGPLTYTWTVEGIEEGFAVVDRDGRRLGTVASVAFGSPPARPDLQVAWNRSRWGRRRTEWITTGVVEEVRTAERRVVLGGG